MPPGSVESFSSTLRSNFSAPSRSPVAAWVRAASISTPVVASRGGSPGRRARARQAGCFAARSRATSPPSASIESGSSFERRLELLSRAGHVPLATEEDALLNAHRSHVGILLGSASARVRRRSKSPRAMRPRTSVSRASGFARICLDGVLRKAHRLGRLAAGQVQPREGELRAGRSRIESQRFSVRRDRGVGLLARRLHSTQREDTRPWTPDATAPRVLPATSASSRRPSLSSIVLLTSNAWRFVLSAPQHLSSLAYARVLAPGGVIQRREPDGRPGRRRARRSSGCSRLRAVAFVFARDIEICQRDGGVGRLRDVRRSS